MSKFLSEDTIKACKVLLNEKKISEIKEEVKVRSLSEIADEIRQDWKKVSPYAEPYLNAMMTLDSIKDNYMLDSGASIVAYFLSNSTPWKGEKAREIKKELNAMLKSSYKNEATEKENKAWQKSWDKLNPNKDKSKSQDPTEIATSFINGNKSWVKEQIGKDIKLFIKVCDALKIENPAYIDSFKKMFLNEDKLKV